jgi:hypothetical protein
VGVGSRWGGGGVGVGSGGRYYRISQSGAVKGMGGGGSE